MNLYRQLGLPPLSPSQVVFRGFSGNVVRIIGECEVHVEVGERKTANLRLLVSLEERNLFGFNWCEAFDLIEKGLSPLMPNSSLLGA